jgi:hypothetical protein
MGSMAALSLDIHLQAQTFSSPTASELSFDWSARRKTPLTSSEQAWIAAIEKNLPAREPRPKHLQIFDEAKSLFLNHAHSDALQKLNALELELAQLGPSPASRRALGELEALRANIAAAQSDLTLLQKATRRVLSVALEHSELVELLPSGAPTTPNNTEPSTGPRWESSFSQGLKRSLIWRDKLSTEARTSPLSWNPLAPLSEAELFQILYASRPSDLHRHPIKILLSERRVVTLPATPGLQERSNELPPPDSLSTSKSFWKSPWVYAIAVVLAGGAAYGIYEATRPRETE